MYVRGVYNEFFMYHDHFYLINDSVADASIDVQFPSGTKRHFDLKKGASKDFVVYDTGEGGIFIFVNGEPRHPDSYVTSMNPLTILVVNDKTTSFSQVFKPKKSEHADDLIFYTRAARIENRSS